MHVGETSSGRAPTEPCADWIPSSHGIFQRDYENLTRGMIDRTQLGRREARLISTRNEAHNVSSGSLPREKAELIPPSRVTRPEGSLFQVTAELLSLSLGSFARCWLVSVGALFLPERKIWGAGPLQHFPFSPPAEDRNQRA